MNKLLNIKDYSQNYFGYYHYHQTKFSFQVTRVSNIHVIQNVSLDILKVVEEI